MAILCAWVILGTRIPLLELVISSIALPSGVAVPIPTLFCADTFIPAKKKETNVMNRMKIGLRAVLVWFAIKVVFLKTRVNVNRGQ